MSKLQSKSPRFCLEEEANSSSPTIITSPATQADRRLHGGPLPLPQPLNPWCDSFMDERAKIVWVLFGNMTDFESDIDRLKNAYRSHRSTLRDRGYTLGIPNYPQSKDTLSRLLGGDDASRAVVWHSHGASGRWGPRGHLVDRDGSEITPADIVALHIKLEFAALFGCSIAKDTRMLNEWRKAFGVAEHTGPPGSFESRMIADTRVTWFWGMRYGRMEPPAQRFAQYEFPRWVRRL